MAEDKLRVAGLWLAPALCWCVVSGNSGVFPLYLERIFYYSIDRVVLFMSSYWVWLEFSHPTTSTGTSQ